MKLSKLDRVILDVLSTYFVVWRGYPIYLYEVGLFASYFARLGLLHLYGFIYLGILAGMTGGLLFIKHEVTTGEFHDELVLLLLVGAICFGETFLTGVVVSNFLVGVNKPPLSGVLQWLIYLSAFVTIIVYTWDELKELFGLGVCGED